MKILITNNTLHHRAGSELYVRDIAIELSKRGHHITAFSTLLGDVADELRSAGIAVIDNLQNLTDMPDIIHGHHHFDTMAALLHFPETPAISFCHGWLPWEETPIKFPSIMRYIAVSQLCYNRLVCEAGIDPQKVQILHNFVNTSVFQCRLPLPIKPKKALIFSNYSSKNDQHVKIIKKACDHQDIQLEIIGLRDETAVANPEKILGEYDLVFAKGRAAIEAMCVGSAVILADSIGMGKLVTSENFLHFRNYNFAFQVMRDAFTVERVIDEIKKYDSHDVNKVSALIRENNAMHNTVTKLESIYHDAITQYKKNNNTSFEQLRSASSYIVWLKKHKQENYKSLSENRISLDDHHAYLQNAILHYQKRKSLWKRLFAFALLGQLTFFAFFYFVFN